MEPQLYASLAQRASDLVSAGDHAQALAVLERLIASDLPDRDRAFMCLNTAVVYDQQGRPEEALAAYARAMEFERSAGGYFVEQHRAAYFSQLGMYDESIRCYEALLARPDLAPDARSAFTANIATLQALR